jgi:predicted Rossmann fold nucleotide-binding protein DprA/Smf involved in DNA uptake
MSYSTELRQRIATGIAELEADLAKLREALATLDATDDAPPASPPVRARRPRALAPAPSPREVVPSGKLAALLATADNGLTTSELAGETNSNPDQVLTLLKELEQAGRARRTGAKRSTRWFAADPSVAEEPAAEEPAAVALTANGTPLPH